MLGLWGILVLGPLIVEHARARRSHGSLGWIPFFSTEPTVGSSMFAAILILTIMIVPIVSSICRELFVSVPSDLKEGALALGATRWEMVRGVVFPYARAGIAAALILGLGRAIGEAIAVTQVIGNRVSINSWNLFEPGDTLASRIASQYQGADTSAPDRVTRLPRGHPARLLAGRQPARAADRPPRRGPPPDPHERAVRPQPTSSRASTCAGGSIVEPVMEGLAATVAALLAVAVLVIVVGSVAKRGLGAINLDFFTQDAVVLLRFRRRQPPGSRTRSSARSIIVGIAVLMALPVGILDGDLPERARAADALPACSRSPSTS